MSYARKHTFNEHYFDTIDTEAKAYFLGFLFADGHNQTSRNSVSLKLHSKDFYILECLKNDVKYSGSITKVKKTNQHILLLCSKTLSITLEKIGMTHNK